MPRTLEEALSSAAVINSAAVDSPARWVNDKKLAAHLDISIMSLWRLRQDPTMNFPLATKVMGSKRTSLDEVDQWMRQRRQTNDDAA